MSDRYQSLIHTPVGQLLAKNLGLPNPVRLERWTEGDPLVDGTVVGRRRRPARQGAWWPRSTSSASPPVEDAARRPEVQGPGLRRHRDHLLRPARRAAGVLHPAAAQPRGAARASSCSALRRSPPTPPRSASPSAPSRASPARSARRSAAAAPSSSCTSPRPPTAPLASTLAFLLSPKSAYVSGQVVRIGVARRDRRGRGGRRLDPARWPARSPSSPAPAAASASRSPGSCTATARRSSGIDVPQAASELQAVIGRARRRPPHASTSPPRTRRSGSRRHVKDDVRRRRHRRAQRRHHPRQAADEHEGRHLRLGDRGQPHRARADHRRAARRRS